MAFGDDDTTESISRETTGGLGETERWLSATGSGGGVDEISTSIVVQTSRVGGDGGGSGRVVGCDGGGGGGGGGVSGGELGGGGGGFSLGKREATAETGSGG